MADACKYWIKQNIYLACIMCYAILGRLFCFQKRTFWNLIIETSDRVVILVINIVIAQIAFSFQSSPSGDGFYACELGKICSKVIWKNIT